MTNNKHTVFLLALAWTLSGTNFASSENLDQDRTVELISGLSREIGGLTSQPSPDHTCFIQSIACGQTVFGALEASDCDLEDGFYADFWEFSGEGGQEVTIDLASIDFDPVVFLLDPDTEVVSTDDDGGAGTDARLTYTLDQTGFWTIAAVNFASFDLGDYLLQLECSSGDDGGGGEDDGSCGEDLLCLGDGRFEISVDWRTSGGDTGTGTAVPETSDSGLFWFFEPDNIEMLIKVLNGCPVNNFRWVYFAATTDVEFTVRVTDTETDTTKTYFNPLGQPANAVTDSRAFDTCP